MTVVIKVGCILVICFKPVHLNFFSTRCFLFLLLFPSLLQHRAACVYTKSVWYLCVCRLRLARCTLSQTLARPEINARLYFSNQWVLMLFKLNLSLLMFSLIQDSPDFLCHIFYNPPWENFFLGQLRYADGQKMDDSHNPRYLLEFVITNLKAVCTWPK